MDNMQVGDKFKQEFIVTPEIYEQFIKIFKDTNPMDYLTFRVDRWESDSMPIGSYRAELCW